MSETLPEDVAEATSTGVTRRELFQIGNVIALPVLLGGVRADAEAAAGPLRPGPEIYQSIGVEPIIKPRIALGAGGDRDGEAPGTTSISVTAWMMQPGDDKVVADRIHGVLSRKRSPRSTDMTAPGANLNGRWDVTVEFFSSTSQHTLFIEQDGNWIKGSHQADLSVRDIVGTIEGNQVTLRSAALRPAPTFIFAGTVSGDTISGPIYMGEYLNAKFTARRHSYPSDRTRIVVPGGPPLAT